MAPMSRLFLAFLFLAVALGGTMAVAPTPVGSQSGIGVVIDADVTGNTPRLVPAGDRGVLAGRGGAGARPARGGGGGGVRLGGPGRGGGGGYRGAGARYPRRPRDRGVRAYV